MSEQSKAEARVSQAKTFLLVKQPFFGSIALQLEFTEVPDADCKKYGMPFPTMATDGLSIVYCPSFVMKMTVEELAGVIVHEIMHIIFRHHLRRMHRHPIVWNLAGDVIINHLIRDKWKLKIPEDGIYPEVFPFLKGVDIANTPTEKIYEMFPIPPSGGGGGNDEGDGGGDGNGKGPQSPKWGGVNDAPGANDSSASANMEAQVQQMVAAATAVAKSIGKMPGGMEGIIDSEAEAEVDWRDSLRRIIGGDQPEDYTYSRPNKKAFYQYGMVNPTSNRRGAGHVVIGIDTSGSVTDKELTRVFPEVKAILEENGPERVTIIQCDAHIQRVDVFEQGESIEYIKIKGRGGTRVSPVFEYVEKHGLEVTNLVYFSDMEIDDVPKSQPYYPVTWVNVSGRGGHVPAWGELVRISGRHLP